MRVVQRAGLKAQAAAADAAVKIISQPRQHRDALVQRGAKGFADPRPIALGRRAPIRQAVQLLFDLGEGVSKLLRNHHKAQPPQIGAVKSTLPPCIAPRPDQTLCLVIPDRRNS